MKFRLCVIVIFLLASNVFPQALEKARLTGTVTDTAGASISGVRVTARSSAGKEVSAVADEKGDYAISLPKDDYVLIYSGAIGFAERTILGFIKSSNFRSHYEIDARLDINPEGSIITELTASPEGDRREGSVRCFISRSDHLTLVGTVVDSNQARISGAAVSAADKGGRVYTVTTDNEGRYKLDLPKGEFTIAFGGAFFSTVRFDLKVDQLGVRSIDALLEAGPQINTIEVSEKKDR
jgi:hypothetical protein